MGFLAKICVILFCSGLEAYAENICTEKDLVVDVAQSRDFSSFLWTLPLPSYSSIGGRYETGAVVDFLQDTSPYLNINFRFDLPEEIVANPYNIYRLEFDVGEGEDQFHFESGNCTGSIGSFGPTEALKVYPIKISPHKDGSPRAVEKMRIKIWGHQ